MVAGFGAPLYVDDENTIASYCSTLRIAINCVDPSKIPEVIILHYDGKWRRCIVAVLGWSHDEYRGKEGKYGPSYGGRQLIFGWPTGGHPYNQTDDKTNRSTISQAHATFLRNTGQNQPPGQSLSCHEGQSPPSGSTDHDNPPSPGGKIDKRTLTLDILLFPRRSSAQNRCKRTVPHLFGSSVPSHLIIKLCNPIPRSKINSYHPNKRIIPTHQPHHIPAPICLTLIRKLSSIKNFPTKCQMPHVTYSFILATNRSFQAICVPKTPIKMPLLNTKPPNNISSHPAKKQSPHRIFCYLHLWAPPPCKKHKPKTIPSPIPCLRTHLPFSSSLSPTLIQTDFLYPDRCSRIHGSLR